MVGAKVTPKDRELFIYLLGFDAVDQENEFQRIRDGEFDNWKKMQAIVAFRHGLFFDYSK